MSKFHSILFLLEIKNHCAKALKHRNRTKIWCCFGTVLGQRPSCPSVCLFFVGSVWSLFGAKDKVNRKSLGLSWSPGSFKTLMSHTWWHKTQTQSVNGFRGSASWFSHCDTRGLTEHSEAMNSCSWQVHLKALWCSFYQGPAYWLKSSIKPFKAAFCFV